MAIVTISSVRGSPGVTSWSLLLAGAWPTESALERVVVEADCDGGVLGARYGIGVDPGAVSLISACRRHDESPPVADHGRPVADGVWLIPGPEVADQAIPAWRSGAVDVADRLENDPRVWLFDLGRFRADSPLVPIAARSSLNLVVVGPRIEDIVQAPARVESLSRLAPTGVILVGKSVHEEDELHRFFGGRALWAVPGGENLPVVAMGAFRSGRARRSRSWRAALDVAADVAALVAGPHTRVMPGPPGVPPAHRLLAESAGRSAPEPRPHPHPQPEVAVEVEVGPAVASGPVPMSEAGPGMEQLPGPLPVSEMGSTSEIEPVSEPMSAGEQHAAEDDGQVEISPAVRAAAEYAHRGRRRSRSRWTR